MAEQVVQVSPDGTGKKVRTTEVHTQVGGTDTAAEQQVVSIAEEGGSYVHWAEMQFTMTQILFELRKIRWILGSALADNMPSDEENIEDY